MEIVFITGEVEEYKLGYKKIPTEHTAIKATVSTTEIQRFGKTKFYEYKISYLYPLLGTTGKLFRILK